jgi:hypothetical protein
MRCAIPALALVVGLAGVAVAEAGYLFVDSDPPGATITIDASPALQFEAPVLCTLSAGRHKVAVSKPYYKPKTFEIDIEPDRVSRKVVTFLKSDLIEERGQDDIVMYSEFGELTVLTDVPGPKVFIDSVQMKTPAPVTLEKIAAGQHLVTLVQGDMSFDTTVIVPVGRPTVVNIPISRLTNPSGAIPPGGPVKVRLRVDLPGCSYIRSDERLDLKSNMTISGVDPKIRFEVGDSTIELSHQNLAVRGIRKNSLGEVVAKKIPDTTMNWDLVLPYRDTIRADIVVYAWAGERHFSRDRLVGKKRRYDIAGDFNRGLPINIHLILDEEGRIMFKYW